MRLLQSTRRMLKQDQEAETNKKARISGLFYRLGAAAPLRILFSLLTVWSVSC